MRTAIIIIALWLASTVAVCGQPISDSYLDHSTGLVFPKMLGKYTRAAIQEFTDKRLGVMIQYRGKANAYVAIYDNGRSDIATGTDSDAVKSEFLRIQQELLAEASKGPFSNPQKFSETAPAAEIKNADKVAKVLAAMYTFSMRRRDGTELQFESWVLLTGFKRKFLKLRFSLPNGDPKVSQEELKSFISEFLEANQKEQANFYISHKQTEQ